MPSPRVLWLVRFRASEARSDLNEIVRREVVSVLEAAADIEDVFAGCRDAEGGWEYLVAATLANPDAARDLDASVIACLKDRSPVELAGLRSSSPAVRTFVRFAETDELRLLRVFEGEVREGMLDTYAEAARDGTIEDARRGEGPAALILAADCGSHFTTVSVWPAWATIEAATGGNVRQPISSKRHEGLIGGVASHYELLAGAKVGPATSPDAES